MALYTPGGLLPSDQGLKKEVTKVAGQICTKVRYAQRLGLLRWAHTEKEYRMNIRKIAIVLSLLAVLLAGTVLSAGAATPMHVSSFQVTYLSGLTKARVRVLDSLNQPVAGAKVQVSFEKDGSPTILRSGTTGTYGRVGISASLPAGSWRVCVEEIHKLGYAYNPANNLCASIHVP